MGAGGAHEMAGVPEATHSPSLHKFSIVIDADEAVLLYRDEGGNTWDAYHTEVPPSQRGKGLGAVLAQVTDLCIIIMKYLLYSLLQALFAHASNNNLRIRVSCTYLQHYVTKHPELNKLCVF